MEPVYLLTVAEVIRAVLRPSSVLKSKFLDCNYLGVCGGCAWGLRPIDEQREAKLAEMRALLGDVKFPDFTFKDTPSARLRDRVDLTWHDGKLGLFTLDRREILAFERCPMLSPALESFFIEYRARVPAGVRRGSVRLRVSPTGERGVWLDFANVDIKGLFDEGDYLGWLSQLAHVEIGQRRKTLTQQDGRPKLLAPDLRPWFETYDAQMRPIPLYGPVAGFTQAGFVTNRALIETVTEAVVQTGITRWGDYFCGNGNFTLALAARGLDVAAIELDPLAVEGLERSCANHPEWRVNVRRQDLYHRGPSLILPSANATEGLLVDPPRAGLGRLIEELAHAEVQPRALIYVSCFGESFARDTRALVKMGYDLTALVGLDQFANSPHAEWVGTFQKI